MASEIGIDKLIPWNGSTGTGKDNRSVIDSNFEKLESYVRTTKIPYVGENGNWWVGSVDTGAPAKGADGADGKDGEDGEVTLVQLGVKADKSLTDSSPVTYFKSASGGASEDLTATLRASITPVVWMNENQWFTGSATDSVNAYFRLYDSTLEGQIAKRAAVKLQLAPNTWYEVTGLNNPMAKYTFDPAQWVNDRGTIPLVSGNMPMAQNNPPTALLTALRATGTAYDQGYGALELIYSRYGESFRFKTGTTAQWLIILVRWIV